jgi:AP-4 complex subunit mu-1
MSYSQFYVLSPRGDSIIYRDFRHDVSKSTVEIFFRNCKFWNGKNQEAPPVFVRQHDNEASGAEQSSRDERHHSDVSLFSRLLSSSCVQNMDGINYLYIKKNGLFFVFTTRHNVSPSLGLELLTRLTKLFKDYLGVSARTRDDDESTAKHTTKQNHSLTLLRSHVLSCVDTE